MRKSIRPLDDIIGKDLESLDRSTNRTATFQESALSMLHVTYYLLKTIGTDEIDVINSNSYTLLLVCRSKGHFRSHRHTNA